VTQNLVFDYIVGNPGANPIQIAEALDAPVANVKARLMSLLYKGIVERKMTRSRLDCMFYYPKGYVKVTK
jgi:DNA-binding MarR family transcriptional regulator